MQILRRWLARNQTQFHREELERAVQQIRTGLARYAENHLGATSHFLAEDPEAARHWVAIERAVHALARHDGIEHHASPSWYRDTRHPHVISGSEMPARSYSDPPIAFSDTAQSRSPAQTAEAPYNPRR